jgi:uncharacterized protein (DUF39 family)
MDEIVEIEEDPSEKFVHQLTKLLLGVAAGYIVGEMVKASYDRFVVNRNNHSSEES